MSELAVINALCRTFQPDAIFEIGTFLGRTTINLAANSQAKVITLDLPPKVETVLEIEEGDHKYVEKQTGAVFLHPPKDHSSCVNRIEQVFGDTATFDFSPYYGAMDMVFVDGAHSYEYVVNDTAVAFKLLRPGGGVIVWHDYSSWEGVTRALNELTEKRPELHLVHVLDTSLVICATSQ